MIPVLHIVSNLSSGGVEHLLANYYSYIDAKVIRFDFITHNPNGELEDTFIKRGSRIFHLARRRQHPIRAARQAFHLFKTQNYKLVHLHGGVEIVPELIMAWAANIPVRIVHSHRYIAAPRLGERLIRLIGICCIQLFATHYFACSEQAGQWVFGKHLCRTTRYHKLPNAICYDCYAFREDIRIEMRQKLHVEDKLVIGHIGRFTHQKNHAYLIPIIRSLLEIRKDFVLFLVGEGELEEEIHQVVEKEDLTAWVRFLGVRDDVPQLLQAMDVFVLPSNFEGLPVSGIEAQAAGLPCVFSDGITKETTISEQVCYLHLKDSPEVWANKILDYATTPRHSYVNTFPAEYNVQSQAMKLEEFYLKAGHLTK